MRNKCFVPFLADSNLTRSGDVSYLLKKLGHKEIQCFATALEKRLCCPLVVLQKIKESLCAVQKSVSIPCLRSAI